MAGHKNVKPAQKGVLPPVEKENVAPKKIKQKISVASLFDQQHDLRRKAKQDTYDILAPKAGGVYKHYAPPKRSEQNPLLRKFLGVTQAYRDGVSAGQGGQLDSIYEDLIAKVDELAVNGAANESQPGEEADQINALSEEHERLAKPLGEDKIEIQRTKADGTTVVQERKLSETIAAFERVLNSKRKELEELFRELGDVDEEIATVKEDIAAAERNEVAKLKQTLDSQVDDLIKQAAACKEMTISEVEKARRKEKKATDEQNQKFEDFMRSIVGS